MEAGQPGWYPDPHTAGTTRYWDGEQWTDQISVAPAPPESDQAGLIAAGWIGMLVFPIVGIVIGLVLANRKPRLGLTMAGLSLVAGLVWMTLLSN